jgi:hypothetical protein
MSVIQPPPTAQLPVLTGEDGSTTFNPIWLQWLLTLIQELQSFNGAVLQHDALTGLQGGGPLGALNTNQFFHLALADYNTILGGGDASSLHNHFSGTSGTTGNFFFGTSPATFTNSHSGTTTTAIQDYHVAIIANAGSTITGVSYNSTSSGAVPVGWTSPTQSYYVGPGEGLVITFTGASGVTVQGIHR